MRHKKTQEGLTHYEKLCKEITKSGIKRLTLRAGIERRAQDIERPVREYIFNEMTEIVRQATILAKGARRCTVNTDDVKNAVGRVHGRTIYGYNN
tara:strand:- start:148 stop:432 length:285 start_codon:yes stop_codon:yes gene_type:complete